MSSNIKVGIIITNKKKNILLIKEKTAKNKRPLWNIIKGTYGDNGEETIFEAAKRECLEEASVKVKLTDFAGCYLVRKKDNYQIQFNFIGRIFNGRPAIAKKDKQKLHNEFITEVKWFDRKTVKKIPAKKFVSKKIYIMIQDWLKGKTYPLSAFKQLKKMG